MLYHLRKAAAILAIFGSVLFLSACSENGSPPVINSVWPPNAATLSADQNAEWLTAWRSQPHLEITFDRQMDEEHLQALRNWLRVWQVLNYGDNEIFVKAVYLSYTGVTGTPLTGAEGVTAVYNIVTPPLDPPLDKSPRYLVQIVGDNIVDMSTEPLLLDADFKGTELSATILDYFWSLPGEGWSGDEAWDGLVDTGESLPSGDDREGGRFHSFFEVESG